MAQRMKHGCEKLLNHNDHLHNFAFFYPYAYQENHELDYHVKAFVKDLKKAKNIDLDMESILMYESLSTASSSGYVLTRDHIYSNYLKKRIRLDGLIGIYPKNQKLIAAVYEDMHEEVIEHSHSYIGGLEEDVFHSINCMMIYR